MTAPVSRRAACLTAIAAALGSTAALAAMTSEAEAKRGWKGGRGRGWAMTRGRKHGWTKRGGPRWWRGF